MESRLYPEISKTAKRAYLATVSLTDRLAQSLYSLPFKALISLASSISANRQSTHALQAI